MSVCNAASILAAAGLLDGQRATINKAYWALATAPGPKVQWIRHARWVESGKFVTSSGVSAGIDMSLSAIARLFGRPAATSPANGTEYEWHEDPAWDPFAELHGLAEKKEEEEEKKKVDQAGWPVPQFNPPGSLGVTSFASQAFSSLL